MLSAAQKTQRGHRNARPTVPRGDLMSQGGVRFDRRGAQLTASEHKISIRPGADDDARAPSSNSIRGPVLDGQGVCPRMSNESEDPDRDLQPGLQPVGADWGDLDATKRCGPVFSSPSGLLKVAAAMPLSKAEGLSRDRERALCLTPRRP